MNTDNGLLGCEVLFEPAGVNYRDKQGNVNLCCCCSCSCGSGGGGDGKGDGP